MQCAERIDGEISRLVGRIHAEYREMPGLSLTKAQMQRLWGIEPFVCDALVDALITAGVLRRTRTGSYVAHGSQP